MFNNKLESLSRSSSTCSLLSSTIKQQQQQNQQHEQEQQENQQQETFRLVNKSSSSSPGLMNDFFMGTSMVPPLSSSVSASNNSSIELPFSFNVGPIGCSSNISPCLLSKTSEVSSFSFGSAPALSTNGMLNLNNSKKPTKYDLSMQANSSGDFMNMNGGENSIDWSLLSDTSRYMSSSVHQAAKDETLQWLLKMNKEFYWNIKKLTEMTMMANYSKMNVSTESSFTNSALPTNCLSSSNCNINVNNNANFGMNNNMNKMSRKLGGNHSLQMPISNGQRQTVSPNMQPHPAVVNKYFSMNQQQPQQQQPNNLMYHPIQQQQQQKLNNNLSYQQSNYNQQFNSNNTNSRIFGRIITNNRGYTQRVQC